MSTTAFPKNWLLSEREGRLFSFCLPTWLFVLLLRKLNTILINYLRDIYFSSAPHKCIREATHSFLHKFPSRYDEKGFFPWMKWVPVNKLFLAEDIFLNGGMVLWRLILGWALSSLAYFSWKPVGILKSKFSQNESSACRCKLWFYIAKES